MAEQIEERAEHPFPWKSVVKRSIVLVVAGVTIYLVFPSITEVFASWPKLSKLAPLWFAAAIAAQVAHFVCTCWLQRIALRTKAWYSVVTAQLSGNAISLVVPGGAAAGAALQFRMLGTAGMDTTTAVGGLTAFSLLGIAGLLLLPLFVLPAILFGVPVNQSLAHAAFVGIGAFVLFAAFGAVVLATDRPLQWIGGVVESVRNRIARRRHKPEVSGTGRNLLHERDRILEVFGRKWKQALLLSSGRLAFDYFTLLFALRATGSRPHPSLVLLAYALAGLLALVPITPGGLGIVEAGLSGLLVLAGVPGGNAVLATLAYRIISYWLPMLAGPVAYVLFRVRYGPPTGHPAVAVT
jgi:uncharacterized protein (TIRG00374 family)